MLRLLTHAFLLCCVGVIALFAFSNQEGVAISFFPLPYEVVSPLYLLIPVLFLLGFALGVFSSSFAALKRKAAIRKLEKRNRMLEDEIKRIKVEKSLSDSREILVS